LPWDGGGWQRKLHQFAAETFRRRASAADGKGAGCELLHELLTLPRWLQDEGMLAGGVIATREDLEGAAAQFGFEAGIAGCAAGAAEAAEGPHVLVF